MARMAVLVSQTMIVQLYEYSSTILKFCAMCEVIGYDLTNLFQKVFEYVTKELEYLKQI